MANPMNSSMAMITIHTTAEPPDEATVCHNVISVIEYMYKCMHLKIHVPRAHEVKNQRVMAKRTSQTMKYGQYVIIQNWTDDNIQYGKWY